MSTEGLIWNREASFGIGEHPGAVLPASPGLIKKEGESGCERGNVFATSLSRRSSIEREEMPKRNLLRAGARTSCSWDGETEILFGTIVRYRIRKGRLLKWGS